MLSSAFVVELAVVTGFPLALGAWIHRRWSVSWLLFSAGAVTFGLSQAVHLPLNAGILSLLESREPAPGWAMAVILGLTAGICEETARYLAFRWVLGDQKERPEAVMFGAGHGGIESIVFVGFVVGAAFLNMSVLKVGDLDDWSLPAGQLPVLRAQLDVYWSQAWYLPLLGAAERLFSIAFHIGMAVLAQRAAIGRRLGIWLAAVGLHSASNTLVLMAGQAGWHPAAIEGLVGLFAILALAIVRLVWERDGEPSVRAALVDQEPLRLQTAGERRRTAEQRLRERIEESKWE